VSLPGREARPRVAWREVDGILLLDKPVGLSSNQALQRARRLFRAAKAGHTGSLDPLASGVLPLCFGQATKVSGLLLDADKTYRARLALGVRTTTGDAEGEIVERLPVPPLAVEHVAAVLAGLTGPQDQLPPMYSALKRDGRPLYELAREGIEVPREPRRIVVYRLVLLDLATDALEFEVHCSKGTYVRTLGEDLARALGTCGHLAALRRTAVAAFDGQPTYALADLEALAGDESALDARLLPVDAALQGWRVVRLDVAGEEDFRHGRSAACTATVAGEARVYGPTGTLLGLGTVSGTLQHVAPDRLLTAAAGISPPESKASAERADCSCDRPA
jgi:tRNA pseudouridine55 synthase